MIEGTVTAAHEAVVPLSLQAPEGRTKDIKAVVDIGYSGFLTLPVALVVAFRVCRPDISGQRRQGGVRRS